MINKINLVSVLKIAKCILDKPYFQNKIVFSIVTNPWLSAICIAFVYNGQQNSCHWTRNFIVQLHSQNATTIGRNWFWGEMYLISVFWGLCRIATTWLAMKASVGARQALSGGLYCVKLSIVHKISNKITKVLEIPSCVHAVPQSKRHNRRVIFMKW